MLHGTEDLRPTWSSLILMIAVLLGIVIHELIHGFIPGILGYVLSLALGNGDLFWFSLVHTSAAGGGWLILWLIPNVKANLQMGDHPTHAGCYVLES